MMKTKLRTFARKKILRKPIKKTCDCIQTKCFFFLEKKVTDLYEQSRQCVLLAVGAY